MNAQNGIAGGLHGAQVERHPHMPRGENRERVRPRSAGETVTVGAGQGRTPGVKARRGPLRHAHRNVGRQHLVDGPLGPVEVGTGVNVGGHHLSPGMHPGVGTSGAGQHYGVPQGPLQGTAEGTGDRVHTALGGEAVKRGPQVGDEQTHPTRRQGPGNGPRRYHCRDGGTTSRDVNREQRAGYGAARRGRAQTCCRRG